MPAWSMRSTRPGLAPRRRGYILIRRSAVLNVSTLTSLAVAEQGQDQADHQAGDEQVFEAGVAVAHAPSIG